MKMPFFFAPKTVACPGNVATGSLLLGLMLVCARAQSQPSVPAPNGDPSVRWVAVDDQIVPAAAIIGSAARKDFNGLAFYPGIRKWPGGRVPYAYDENMPASKKTIFESACREWEKHANLTFFPRTSEDDYIVVVSTPDTSNSAVGMSGGSQALRLADWANKLTAVHELAHALGVMHEQSRSDRDAYVTIHSENVADGMMHNFAKIAGSLNQGTYDFDSVMHYHSLAFSKNGKETITANEGYTQFQRSMGQRSRLSELDKTGMAQIYGAPGPNSRGVIQPLYPKTKDLLTAKPTGKGTANQYSYVWKKNGAVIAGASGHTLDLSVDGYGDKGDVITVEIAGPDEEGKAGVETAAITVINSAPVTPAREFVISPDRTYRDQLAGTDDDGDALVFMVTTGTERGQLNLNKDGSFTYQPEPGIEGADSFKVAADDGQSVGLPATMSIRLAQENRTPTLADAQLSAVVEQPFSGQLNGFDADNDTLSYSLIGGALPAGLSLAANGAITGTPTKAQTAQAQVLVFDGRGASATALLIIEVKNAVRAPSVTVTLTPSAPATNEKVSASAVVANFTGDVAVRYDFKVNGQSVQAGASNTLDLSVPGRGERGEIVSCEVTATGASGTATSTARVQVRNSAPFARSGTGMADADVSTVFDLGGFDFDGDALRINIVGGPNNGTAILRADQTGVTRLFYRSRAGFAGTDVIRFTVSDGEATSENVSTFAVAVKSAIPAVNRAPVALDMALNALVGQPTNKTLLARDPDGDALTFRLINNARYGASEIRRDSDGQWKLFYTSLNRFYGPDRVTYVAVDSKGKQSNVATATIGFINRAPVAQGNALSVISGTPVSQYLLASDPDNDAVSFRLVNNPLRGQGAIKRDEQGAWRVYYQSVPGYVGVDRITFIAIDAQGKESQAAAIEINVVRAPATSPNSALRGAAPAPSSGNS